MGEARRRRARGLGGATCERIMAAAIKVPYRPGASTGRIVSLPAPARHHDILARISGYQPEPGMVDQGFLTDRNRFVDRRTAMTIARRAGQLVCEPTIPDTLYSEDVW